jgi:hypothetical protein
VRFCGAVGAAGHYPALGTGRSDQVVDAIETDPVEAFPGMAPPHLPTWWARVRPGLTITVVFAIGIAAGAYAWDRHRTDAAVAAEQSHVDLSASIRYLNRYRDRVEVGVTLTNHGQYAVTAGPPRFVNPLVVADPGADVPVSIKPGESSDRTLTADFACADDVPPSATTADLDLAATVTTIDGARHEVHLQIDERGLPFAADLTRICGAPHLTVDDVYLYATSIGQLADGSVTSQVVVADAYDIGRLNPEEARGARLYLDSVETGGGSGAYRVVVTPALPATLTPGAQLSIRWEVADCARALDADTADMYVTFHGRINDTAPGDISLDSPTAELAAALVRMTYTRCGDGAPK